MNRSSMISIFFCLCVISATAWADTTVYKWTDYTRPFKTRLVGIGNTNLATVEVDLPESVVENKEVILKVSSSFSSGSSSGAKVGISVNEKELGSLVIGPNVKVVLDRRLINAGTNKFEFNGSKYVVMDIYDLRIELRELPLAKPTVSQTSPPTAAKSIEATTPTTPESLKIPQPVVRVDPTEPKREVTFQTEQAGTAPKKEIMVPVAGTGFGQRWAVVIGVSEYEDSRIPSLRYAARDAQSVYDWLVSPKGGGFAPLRVNLLIDRKATNENIKDALFTWLKQAIEEDLVVIYFAGHGSPESPDTLRNLYLLPYDTKYSNIAVTGFPMWDIETALKRFIKAKRVVIIADACHSAGVGQSFDMATRAGRGLQVNPINSGLQNLTDLGEGICVISASRDKEFSREGREWGGGHGVFSYYLLEGLKGAADFDKNGSVTIGELTVYVSQQVRRESLNAQNPIVSGRFDPSLTISK